MWRRINYGKKRVTATSGFQVQKRRHDERGKRKEEMGLFFLWPIYAEIFDPFFYV